MISRGVASFSRPRRRVFAWLGILVVGVVALASGAISIARAQETASIDGTWREITTAGDVPAARYLYSAMYDPVRLRMIIFGGTPDMEGPVFFGDVWELALGDEPEWTELFPTGVAPAPRLGHAAVYDTRRDRMIIFGGGSGSHDYADVWALSLTEPVAWTQIVVVGGTPDGRGAPSLIYDPVRDRLIMFGGFHGDMDDSVWVLPLSGVPAWSRFYPPGGPPPKRGTHAAIYDPIRDRMIIFGGGGDEGIYNDTWALSLSGTMAWVNLQPQGPLPPVRQLLCGVYDSRRDRLVVYGGWPSGDMGDTPLDDTWALSLAGDPAWTELLPSGAAPAARAVPGVYDAAGDAMVFFGGMGSGPVALDDSWALDWGGQGAVPDGANPTGAPRARLRLAGPNPMGPGDRIEIALDAPAACEWASLALYDAQGRRLGVLYAGRPGSGELRWSGAVRDLPLGASGRYMLRARTESGVFARPIVVIGLGR